MASEKHFRVTLRKSYTGRPETQRRTLQGLGLRRIGQSVLLKDTQPIRGMIFKVVHLVDVAPQEGPVPAKSQGA